MNEVREPPDAFLHFTNSINLHRDHTVIAVLLKQAVLDWRQDLGFVQFVQGSTQDKEHIVYAVFELMHLCVSKRAQ